MYYRTKGIHALKIMFKNKQVIDELEEIIHDKSINQDEYKLIIQEVIQHKRNNESIQNIIENIKNNKFLTNKSEYDNFKLEIQEINDFLLNPFEVDEGVLTCGKCGSNKTFSYSKQTRGGDESTTVFAICSNCQNKWKI